jgi:hypothetical protein
MNLEKKSIEIEKKYSWYNNRVYVKVRLKNGEVYEGRFVDYTSKEDNEDAYREEPSITLFPPKFPSYAYELYESDIEDIEVVKVLKWGNGDEDEDENPFKRYLPPLDDDKNKNKGE